MFYSRLDAQIITIHSSNFELNHGLQAGFKCIFNFILRNLRDKPYNTALILQII
jgi:hypothetical protein